MPETAFEIARNIGASWKSSAQIRRLEFRVAPNFRVNPASSRVNLPALVCGDRFIFRQTRIFRQDRRA
jgi:hypothetical protein